MSAWNLYASLILSSIALLAILVGKRRENWPLMALGLLQMGASYALTGWFLALSSVILCLGIFVLWRQS